MSRSRSENNVSQAIGSKKRALRFDDLVEQSGYLNVVTTNNPPTVYLHDGSGDTVLTVNGVSWFYVSEIGLSGSESERAGQTLEKLAALGDWASGEIIGRRDRDQERLRTGYYDLKPRLTAPEMLVLRYVRMNPGAALADIVTPIGTERVEIAGVVDQLLDRGILERSPNGREFRVSDEEQRRYEARLAELLKPSD